MRRLISAPANAAPLTRQEQAERAAALAAMGYRLAAAGPRTRQRLISRETPREPEDAPPEIDPVWAPKAVRPLAQTREPAMEPLRASSGQIARHVRRVAILGVSASCGFAVVLMAQSPRFALLHGHGGHGGSAMPVAAEQAMSQEEIVSLASVQLSPVPAQPPPDMQAHLMARVPAIGLAAPTLVVPPVAAPVSMANVESGERAAYSVPAHPPSQLARMAVGKPVAARMAQGPAAPREPKMPARFATLWPASPARAAIAAGAPAKRGGSTARSVQVAAKQMPPEQTRAAHQATAVNFSLPRWLTEDRPSHPHVLVMSEPPHNLVRPGGGAAKASVQTEAAAAPVVILASAQHPSPPLRAPGYRPYEGAPAPYYGPYYPSQERAAETRAETRAETGANAPAYRAAPVNGW